MKNLSLLILICLFLSQSIFAQRKAKVNFVFNPPLVVSEMSINGVPYEGTESNTKKIREGSYNIKYKSDFYVPLDTIMVVKAGKIMNFEIQLKPDPIYLAFREDKKQYDRKKITSIYVPMTFTAGLGILTISHLSNTETYNKRADEIESAYNKAGPWEWDIEKYKVQMEELNRATVIKRRTTTGLVIATGVAAGLTAIMIKKFHKSNKKPKYIDLYGFSIEPQTDSQSSGLALTYTF